MGFESAHTSVVESFSSSSPPASLSSEDSVLFDTVAFLDPALSFFTFFTFSGRSGSSTSASALARVITPLPSTAKWMFT
jgi:hypothetical protein